MKVYRYPNQNARINRSSIIRSTILNDCFFLDFLRIPGVNIQSVSVQKISNQVGKDGCVVVFRSDVSLDQWEARAITQDQSPDVGVGLIVGNGGFVIANEDISFLVEDDELTFGDRVYLVTIYVMIGGVWYG